MLVLKLADVKYIAARFIALEKVCDLNAVLGHQVVQMVTNYISYALQHHVGMVEEWFVFAENKQSSSLLPELFADVRKLSPLSEMYIFVHSFVPICCVGADNPRLIIHLYVQFHHELFFRFDVVKRETLCLHCPLRIHTETRSNLDFRRTSLKYLLELFLVELRVIGVEVAN